MSERSPAEIRLGVSPTGQPSWALRGTDEERLKAALGTVSDDFADVEIGRLISTLQVRRNFSPDIVQSEVNAAIAVIAGISPRNELEALLASQMALLHSTSMDLLGRTKVAAAHMNVQEVQVYGNTAAKLVRAFTASVEALAKLRRPTVQTVRVERVEVRDGGQAFVGAVSRSPEGG